MAALINKIQPIRDIRKILEGIQRQINVNNLTIALGRYLIDLIRSFETNQQILSFNFITRMNFRVKSWINTHKDLMQAAGLIYHYTGGEPYRNGWAIVVVLCHVGVDMSNGSTINLLQHRLEMIFESAKVSEKGLSFVETKVQEAVSDNEVLQGYTEESLQKHLEEINETELQLKQIREQHTVYPLSLFFGS